MFYFLILQFLRLKIQNSAKEDVGRRVCDVSSFFPFQELLPPAQLFLLIQRNLKTLVKEH